MTSTSPFDLMIRDARYSGTNLANLESIHQILNESRLAKKPILFVNSYTCYLAARRIEYLTVLQESICLLDGKPLARIVNRWSESPVFQTRGVDFFSRAIESFAVAGRNQILFGSTETRCEEISEKLSNITGRGIGYICPPFQNLNEFRFDSIAESINALKPEIVWVALGTPKQDFVARELAKLVDSSVVAVGAAFDFYSNPRAESPIWMQRIYLEWLFRLFKEPRRLGKRYLIGNPGFIWQYLKWVGTKSRSKS